MNETVHSVLIGGVTSQTCRETVRIIVHLLYGKREGGGRSSSSSLAEKDDNQAKGRQWAENQHKIGY